jgi:5'(3')-deoxyribonucleotidase
MTLAQRPRLQVFLDLDGVFADFDARVKHLTGKHPSQLDRNRLWKMVNSDKRFFAELELIEGCMVLWEATRDLEPIFLTGAPSSKTFQEQKREWVARIFGPEFIVHVVPKKLKQEFSGPHKVLIDDTPENIEQWIARGGHGILHTGNHESTVQALRRLQELYRAEERPDGRR